MKKNRKRLIALASAGILTISAFPVSASPQTEEETEQETVIESEASVDVLPTDETEQMMIVEVEDDISFMSDLLPDNDELAAGYISSQFYDLSGISFFSTFAGDRLSGPTRNYYDLLAERIRMVAAGELSSTLFQFYTQDIMGKSQFTAAELGYEKITADNVQEAAAKALSYDRAKVIDALGNDMPYELFWYNKTTGGMKTRYSISYSSSGSYVKIETIEVGLTVVDDYQGDSQYSVDQEKLRSVHTAVANAKQIVADAAGMEDLEKLYQYRSSIRNLTDYNYDAAGGRYPGGYGDPWQLVYVFDGDPETKVVCEGYAKAFQYLMDETAFSSDQIYSFTVTGLMGTGPHMWNIIHMDDDEQYLVDVTSSYDPNSRFIKNPDSGSVEAGYVFDHSSYTYDSDTMDLYSREDLTLSSTPYTGKVEPFSISEVESVIAGLNTKVSFHVDAVGAESYRWQYSKDGVKWSASTLSGAKTATLSFTLSEKNADNLYRCKVTAPDGRILYTEPADITLLPAVEISKLPKTVAATVGTTAKFTVTAEYVDSYQWQYSKDGIKWINSTLSTAKSSTLKVTASEKTKGNKYRCVLTGIDGNRSITPARAVIVLDEAPENSKASVGEKARFLVKADGIASYQWQYSKDGGSSWISSTLSTAGTESISFKVTDKNKVNLYRCKLTTADGYTAYTKAVEILT